MYQVNVYHVEANTNKHSFVRGSLIMCDAKTQTHLFPETYTSIQTRIVFVS